MLRPIVRGRVVQRREFQARVDADETVHRMGRAIAPFSEHREKGRRMLGKRIRFYNPNFLPDRNPKFVTISVTGTSCALRCKHCGGKLLRGMIAATSPRLLIHACKELKAKGCLGCLVSGGCLSDGSVPLERFLDAIGWIKRELGFIVFVHPGIVKDGLAMKLRMAGVDAVLIDAVGSAHTLKAVYGLDVKENQLKMSLEALAAVGINFVPHITVGLHYGRLLGERRALELISRHEPGALIINALTPLRGTHMQGVEPPTPDDVARTLVLARRWLPEVPLVLGCMRPGGEHKRRTERLAIEAGIDGIALPGRDALSFAHALGLDAEFSSVCCASAYDHFGR